MATPVRHLKRSQQGTRLESRAAEESVLGCLLLGAPFSAVARLVPDDFTDARHALIFRAAAELGRAGHKIDCDSVAAQLEALNHLQAAGGRETLTRLHDETPTAENVGLYVRHVSTLASQRRLTNWLQAPVTGDDLQQVLERELQILGANSREAQPKAFPLRRLDETTCEEREVRVEQIGLEPGTIAAGVGPPNGGKTSLFGSLALAIAAGAKDWLGLRVRQAPVLYLAPEAPGSVKMRLRAAARHLGFDRVPLYVSDGVPALGSQESSDEDRRRIVETVEAVMAQEETRVGLVVIDTLASCLGGGDENGDGMIRLTDAAKYIAAQTGACVLLLHHPSKGDGTALRGHSSLAAACDTIIRIEVEELTGVRTATLVKSRDHATGLQLRFELEPVALPERDSFGEPLTTIVVRPSNQAAPRPRPGGQRQRELLMELERRYREGERTWDEASICKAGRGLGMHRNTPSAALKGLIQAGYLVGSPMSLSLKHPPEDPK